MITLEPEAAWDSIGEMLSRIQNKSVREAYEAFHVEHRSLALEMPASIDKHHCWPGGFALHNHEVMANFRQLVNNLPIGNPGFSRDDAITACFVHDLDKLLYRYERDTSAPSDAQLKYARTLGIPQDPQDNKNSLSKKIDAAISGETIDVNRMPRHKYRDRAYDFEDSGIVMWLCHEHGLPLSLIALHAVAVHHGGFSALARTKGRLEVQPLGALLHAADYISSQVQNASVDWTSFLPTPTVAPESAEDAPPPPPVD